jgi:predicted N-acetyltransferase YhbS
VLVTDPAHQGEGVASALVRHVFDDRANTTEPAYLETETEVDVPFYGRHGFEVIGQLDVPGGGPDLWLMWRKPHEPS